MARVSPTVEGFRAAFGRPSLTFAEIAWRWTIGASAWALLLFWFFEYLNTLPVTKSDLALLATRQPAWVGRAISHILRGSLNRAVLAALCAALALSVLWIVAGSIGRLATVRDLLEYFRGQFASNVLKEPDEAIGRHALRSLIGLNSLRVGLAWAAVLALVGAAILAGFASTETDPRPGMVLVLFLPLAVLICMAWATLSWLLSLAGILSVLERQDTFGALSAALSFFRDRAGDVFAVSTWTGLAHFVAFSVATTAASLLLGLMPIAPPRLVIAGVIVVTVVYLAIVDWLSMARLAGYICIAEMPEAFALPEQLPLGPAARQQSAPGASLQTTIDPDEPILSDLTSPMAGL